MRKSVQISATRYIKKTPQGYNLFLLMIYIFKYILFFLIISNSKRVYLPKFHTIYFKTITQSRTPHRYFRLCLNFFFYNELSPLAKLTHSLFAALQGGSVKLWLKSKTIKTGSNCAKVLLGFHNMFLYHKFLLKSRKNDQLLSQWQNLSV